MQAQPQRRTRFLQPHLAAFNPRHEVLLWNLWFIGSCPSRIEIQWRYRWCICFICSLLFLLFEKLNLLHGKPDTERTRKMLWAQTATVSKAHVLISAAYFPSRHDGGLLPLATG